MEDTRRVPPEITADQLFGVPRVKECYKCPLCEREFIIKLQYKAFLAHWYDDHDEDERAEAGR